MKTYKADVTYCTPADDTKDLEITMNNTEIVSSDIIQTLANLGFTTDVMTWDTGVYRVSKDKEL